MKMNPKLTHTHSVYNQAYIDQLWLSFWIFWMEWKKENEGNKHDTNVCCTISSGEVYVLDGVFHYSTVYVCLNHTLCLSFHTLFYRSKTRMVCSDYSIYQITSILLSRMRKVWALAPKFSSYSLRRFVFISLAYNSIVKLQVHETTLKKTKAVGKMPFAIRRSEKWCIVTVT